MHAQLDPKCAVRAYDFLRSMAAPTTSGISTLWGPSADDEIDLAWPGERIPEELLALWRHCRTARLYVDVDYGQWGLVLLDPVASSVRTAQARRNQPERLEADDVVLGSFLGDQELVVLAPAERGHR